MSIAYGARRFQFSCSPSTAWGRSDWLRARVLISQPLNQVTKLISAWWFCHSEGWGLRNGFEKTPKIRPANHTKRMRMYPVLGVSGQGVINAEAKNPAIYRSKKNWGSQGVWREPQSVVWAPRRAAFFQGKSRRPGMEASGLWRVVCDLHARGCANTFTRFSRLNLVTC
jgi:hypothetical protein